MKKNYKKLMILGSGPIIIGQAAEFDYSGTQACKSLKEEGIEIVLVNSNPATIMTDEHIADKVYIEPLNVESVEKIIAKERPEGVCAGFGGQTGLNLAMKLKEEGILDKYNVELLGVNSETIKKAEDREAFKDLMIEIGEPIPVSTIANSLEECLAFGEEAGLPLIVRPAYTLGGTGGGIAETMEQLEEICERGLSLSPIHQVLLERSVAGWKEIEYEIIRDSKDNCMVVCNMENIDPVGVHTGDSIVIAPCQTMTKMEHQMLRNSAIKIVRALDVQGGCNVQFALDPESHNYIVIEVNPRVSRSSALASKAAGYPIAKIAAKIAIGYSLDELKNYVTETSSAFAEPTLDYIVLKIPKWPFEKFAYAKRTLGTQMKATGEVMAMDRTFESALLKSISCLDVKFTGLRNPAIIKLNKEEVIEKIKLCDDERIFAIAQGLRLGVSIDEIFQITKIDKWFINGIKNIVELENKLIEGKKDKDIIAEAERMGFSDDEIVALTGSSKEELKAIRDEHGIYPVYKMVDTCANEFEAKTPYYYSCYEKEDENVITDKKKIIVIGSGPIKIGQGVEFDYCCVHGVWAIKDAGYESIIINNNPETVSTDFDTADKLYFETLFIDEVLNIVRKEKPEGVIVQFGGQTSINLASKLEDAGVKILGTSVDSIDMAEDRDRFRNFLEEINIAVPNGIAVDNADKVAEIAEKIGYPVVVRPSYVIGGRAMRVIHSGEELDGYLSEIANILTEHELIVDKYIQGTEIEVDAICDGENILIPGIMEHIERTGIHSGDSITVYPPITLSDEVVKKLVESTEKIAKGLNVIGLVNIQYVFDGKDIYVIEVNPRASRTVPILSKVTGVPMVKLALNAMLGKKLTESEYGTGTLPHKNFYAVKVPVFSTEKLSDVDTFLGPEMKSTGEVLGLDTDLDMALLKGFIGSGIKIPKEGTVYVSLRNVDKTEGIDVIKSYVNKGFKVISSEGTGSVLKENGIDCQVVDFDGFMKSISNEEIDIIINTPTQGNNNAKEGFKIRRKAAEFKVPVFTSIDTAKAFIKAIEASNNEITYNTMKDYLSL
ncbi:carbamoyl-phosphate synthase (glutamine-hydrolyzing) large subunit [Clostridium cylindrosporum]|uniref:Carbamoyl phosphate synthase large chain n=1 Tax=Clostridium cylindrosporum DSM 605 TaxID=1121307 RepID=A0A0J8D9V4_CLOCY|nr:carbamoyl-phosphate synthase (glutamine-hydrolyzing) large subunit [Clostridium cylindrosporum]KMT21089.1 carbamoyl-phosphate synthase large chain CarB [Clostridium cylindrosporum DSM 605]